jgi:hypothetical protein
MVYYILHGLDCINFTTNRRLPPAMYGVNKVDPHKIGRT